MNIPFEIKMKQVIEVYNHDTNETEFLLMQDDEWVKISEEQYNKIRGIK